MRKTRQNIALKLGARSRAEVKRAAGSILAPGTWSVAPEDRGWIALGIDPSAKPPEGWLEELARRAGVIVLVSWRMDSISQGGQDVFVPDVGRWQTIELIHDRRREEHDEELAASYSLPEHFYWDYSHLHPEVATPDLDCAEMHDPWCLECARKGAVQDLMALGRWQPARALYWLIVADDLGHDIGTTVQDLENYTSLHHDDGTQWRNRQLDLVRDYATGQMLERDLTRVAEHLDNYLEHGGELDELEPVLDDLPDDARALVEKRIGAKPFRRVRRRLERIETLYGISAPSTILEHELGQLDVELAAMRLELLQV